MSVLVIKLLFVPHLFLYNLNNILMYYKKVLLIRYKNYIFSARSVRDRWVNIRSTFNHNLRRVDKSRETAQSVSEVYVPCWPLWKPLQFLRESTLKDVNYVSILLSYYLGQSRKYLALNLYRLDWGHTSTVQKNHS